MNVERSICSEIQPLLVDYADRELSGVDHDRVAAHVDCCPHCQDELQRLDTSLDVLKRYWEQLQPAVAIPRSGWAGRSRTARRVAGWAIAAAVLFLIGMTLSPHRWRGSPTDVSNAARSSGTAARDVKPPLDSQSPEHAEALARERLDVVALVFHESQAARLQATMDILKTQPLLTQEVENLRHQLTSGYPVGEERRPNAPN